MAEWTQEELSILQKYYYKEGLDIILRLPNKTRTDCYNKAQELNLKCSLNKKSYTKHKWTDEEIAILKEYYPIEGLNVYKRFDRHTRQSVHTKIKKLGYNNSDKWTEEEFAILKKYYPIEGLSVVKRLPNRNKNAIVRKANRSNIYVINSYSGNRAKRNKWTKEEIETLRKYYPIEGKRVCSRFPKRDESYVLRKVRELKLKYDATYGIIWTDEEIKILLEYYPIEGVLCFDKLPNHSIRECNIKVEELNLIDNTKSWSDEELAILRKYYPTEGGNVFKRLEKRTMLSCQQKACRLGITCASRSVWEDYEIELLKKYYPTEGANVVNRLNNKTRSACFIKASKLDIKRIH